MMNHTETADATILGSFKILVAWALLFIGTTNWTAILTAIALLLTIAFTALQIVKIWRDLKRQARIDKLEKVLGGDEG